MLGTVLYLYLCTEVRCYCYRCYRVCHTLWDGYSRLIDTAGYAVRTVTLQNMWQGGLGRHKNTQKASCYSDVNAITAQFRLRMEVEGAWKTKPFWNYLYEHAQRKGSCGFTRRFRDWSQGCLDFPAVWMVPSFLLVQAITPTFSFFF